MTMMEHDKPLVGSRRRFTEEFKADATALVLNGERSIPRRSPTLGPPQQPICESPEQSVQHRP